MKTLKMKSEQVKKMKLTNCLVYKLWNIFATTIIVASLFSVASTPVHAGFWSDRLTNLLSAVFGGNTAKKATKDTIEDTATKKLADAEKQAAFFRGENNLKKTESSLEKRVDDVYEERQRKVDIINKNRVSGYDFEKLVKEGICYPNYCSTAEMVESTASWNQRAFLSDTSEMSKYLRKYEDWANNIRPDMVKVEPHYRYPYSKITLIEIKSSQSAFDSSVNQFRRYDDYCSKVNRKFGDGFCKVESIIQAEQENIVSTYRRNLQVSDCFVEGMAMDAGIAALFGGPVVTGGATAINYVVCAVKTK